MKGETAVSARSKGGSQDKGPRERALAAHVRKEIHVVGAKKMKKNASRSIQRSNGSQIVQILLAFVIISYLRKQWVVEGQSVRIIEHILPPTLGTGEHRFGGSKPTPEGSKGADGEVQWWGTCLSMCKVLSAVTRSSKNKNKSLLK